ncbi:MAG: NAD(P)-binding domain-containing protein [Ancalomicrobiaceae bacterium]|nr:NAD(P)-binding domain-containing protein [Ancalomicrobiaceae bacterium]
MAQIIDTLVVGAGQAGLLMSQALTKRGIPHIVLEREAVAHRWRTQRWDSLKLQQPNWLSHLPDTPYPPAEADPDGFPTAREMHDFLNGFAVSIGAPVRTGVSVDRLQRLGEDGPFRAETSGGVIEADNVVIATGAMQVPVRPELLRHRGDIQQLTAGDYRNPGELADGTVLVVGGGNSGCQIAEDLLRAGRRVILSLGRHRRVPRRYRGKDIFWWFRETGILRTPVEKMPADMSPIVFAGGGNTIDMRRFAHEGIILTGKLTAVEGDVLTFTGDLGDTLAHGDAFYRQMLDRFDALQRERGLDLPEDAEARRVWPDAPCITHPIRQLHLRDAGVGSIIWATGYRSDYRWIKLPIASESGALRHRKGVTEIPGLYFIGLHWQSNLSSSFVFGVQHDVDPIADEIAARQPRERCLARG